MRKWKEENEKKGSGPRLPKMASSMATRRR